jgi:hypothetical protein
MLGNLGSATYGIEPLTIAEEISRALRKPLQGSECGKTRSESLSLEFESSYVHLVPVGAAMPNKPKTMNRTPCCFNLPGSYPTIWRNVYSMPPRVKSTNPEVLRLTKALTKYYILIETYSQCVRTLPNKSQLYKEAVMKWRHRSEFYRPSWGDEAARARFFSAVDKVCETESRAPERCVLNSPRDALLNIVSSQVAIWSFLRVRQPFRSLRTKIFRSYASLIAAIF